MEKTAAEIKWGQNVYSSPRGKMAASIALLRGNSVEPLKIKIYICLLKSSLHIIKNIKMKKELQYIKEIQ